MKTQKSGWTDERDPLNKRMASAVRSSSTTNPVKETPTPSGWQTPPLSSQSARSYHHPAENQLANQFNVLWRHEPLTNQQSNYSFSIDNPLVRTASLIHRKRVHYTSFRWYLSITVENHSNCLPIQLANGVPPRWTCVNYTSSILSHCGHVGPKSIPNRRRMSGKWRKRQVDNDNNDKHQLPG